METMQLSGISNLKFSFVLFKLFMLDICDRPSIEFVIPDFLDFEMFELLSYLSRLEVTSFSDPVLVMFLPVLRDLEPLDAIVALGSMANSSSESAKILVFSARPSM